MSSQPIDQRIKAAFAHATFATGKMPRNFASLTRRQSPFAIMRKRHISSSKPLVTILPRWIFKLYKRQKLRATGQLLLQSVRV